MIPDIINKYLSAALLCLMFFNPEVLSASGLKITDFTLTEQNTLTGTLSWQHAWSRPSNVAPGNHDAVWLFVKYKDDYDIYKHLKINHSNVYISSENQDNIHHLADPDSLGILLRTAGDTTRLHQVVSFEIELPEHLNAHETEFSIFAIEMVYITGGDFYVGDSVSNNSLAQGHTGMPFLVTGEEAITAGASANQLWANGSITPVSLPAAYPKGHQGFYCMKYEISQGQYADFINTLSYTAQAARMMASPDALPGTAAFIMANRQGLKIMKSGNSASLLPAQIAADGNNNGTYNESDDGSFRACNFLSGDDVAAYLDWAALSPMSETEFEKICRGPQSALAKEFAWGTQLVKNAISMLHDGSEHEATMAQSSADTGRAVHGDLFTNPYLKGPARCGFAADSLTHRVTSGSSYYGCMEMSGNLWELCVNVLQAGSQYAAARGNGRLTAAGHADNLPAANAYTWRGGGWNSLVTNSLSYSFRDLAVSDRVYANLSTEQRRATSGGRGVLRTIQP